jgi:NADH-quinone oxidoreductase subunit J
MATFTGIAGLFLLLEADFLAMAQILIYVGGILALILFAVMLTPPDLGERRLPRLVATTVLVGCATVFLGLEVARSARWFVRGAPLDGRAPGEFGSAREVGVGFLAPDQYVLAFELAAVILTVALVAAVYIARRKKSDLEPEGGGG